MNNYLNGESKSINKSFNKYITVKNAEDEPCTIAEIYIQNKIDYIPKISVIIPVYNVEEYVTQCLETVINQTLKDIEIICIDDGSTDNSLYILKKFAEKDKRITILKQKNLHSGVARNAGLAAAKGKYLSFLDSDDFFELNMLEDMYNKIIEKGSDIAICRTKSIDLDTGQINYKLFNTSLRLDLLPKKGTFSVLGVSKNIFQLFEGWAWDKLFKADFILNNHIKFQNLKIFNDNQFTYTALCLAKSITTLKKRFIIKRHGHKKSLSANRNNDPTCFLSAFNKIKSNLKKYGLYNLVKESFWKWAIKLCIIQLKHLNTDSKIYLFHILHKKFNSWDYIDKSSPVSSRYRSLHYIKYQKSFPTINIIYILDGKYLDFLLVSLFSILNNSEYENFNFIIFYKNINSIYLKKINELKEIHSFNLQTVYLSKVNLEYFSSKECITKEGISTLYRLINYFDNIYEIDKIIYLSYYTIVRKSLLPLLEIDMNNKLVAGVEEISYCKNKAKKVNLQDNIYINDGVLLLNLKEWRNTKLSNTLFNYNKNAIEGCETIQDILNTITDKKKILLSPEFNFMETFNNHKIQYDYEYLKIYRKKNPTIVQFLRNRNNNNLKNNSFTNEFSKYKDILNNFYKIHLTIPIVLCADNNYAPFMYTTMISILENGYKNTYYIFFLLVSSGFSKKIQKLIIELNNKYNYYIYFIFIENQFENIIMKIPHTTLTTYYRLLIGDLLPKEIEKCIYLDVDICALKDLSELFNIDMKDNYIAGVVAAGYYFEEKKNCKRLNLPSMKQYINAGMLVMNLKQIRKDNMTEKFIELSKRNYNSQDQDVLNVACYGKIYTLPPKYNAMVFRLKENSPLLRDLYKEEDIIEANNAPYIIHYSDKKKPWNYIGIYMENYWWDIAKKTPFSKNLFTRENIYKNELKKFYYKKMKRHLNFDRPRTFNEKIQWLKLYESTPIKTRLSDKFLVREWVREKIGEEYLIPLLGVYNKFEDIDFEKLPNKFVIKCNHGSNYNIIVKNKYQLNLTEAKSKIEKWMKENFAFHFGLELQYRDIKHKIIIEKYMDDGTGDLRDYKITCFNGKPNFIWIDSDRHSLHKRNIYDLNWNQLPYMVNPNFSTFPSPEKPKCLKQMVEIASILSKDFSYVRVDLYLINDSIYFGEMTFTSGSGTEEYSPKNFERKLSSLIIFPKLVYNIDTGEYYKLTKNFSLFKYYLFFIFLLLKLIFLLKKYIIFII